MEQREMLIELIDTAFESQENDKCRVCDAYDCAKCVSEYVADYLTANGVVVLPCRCGECEHGRSDIFNDGYIVCGHKGVFMKQDDFCSCAKRKDDIVDLCTTGHLHLGYVEEKGGE